MKGNQILVPEVNPAAEFLEISNDFTDPKELVREAISNAFDAKSNIIRIKAFVDKTSGVDELTILIEDDGEGMNLEQLKAFFGLGFSNRREKDEFGNKSSNAIGEKGHGTKIYFNSRKIEVETVHNKQLITAVMDKPIQTLRTGKIPEVTYSTKTTDKNNGTKIIIYGYNDNNQSGFGHNALKDYILWFTKFGSFEKSLIINTHEHIVLHLSGLGHDNNNPEKISFGHIFPPENTNITQLRKSDKVSPLDYYVAKWKAKKIPVQGMPDSTIDIVFYIEGDQIKREYNKMIHQKYTVWNEGEYNVEQRYGLWLSKDYIPIARRNELVAEKSEWTKYHAFVNSQDFRLTANRASVDNTPPGIMDAISETVKNYVNTKIKPDQKFQKYLEELEKERQYRDANAEEKDFERRKKATLKQKICKHKNILFIEPRQEGGVFSMVMQLLTLNPDLFGFSVVDYDTKFGYDLLVTKDTALDLNRASLKFVEMKYILYREFSHSFGKLSSVICWDTKLANDDKVTDLKGNSRTLRITPPNSDDPKSYTKFMLISDTEDHNIEVFVLKEFLNENLKMQFKNRTKE